MLARLCSVTRTRCATGSEAGGGLATGTSGGSKDPENPAYRLDFRYLPAFKLNLVKLG